MSELVTMVATSHTPMLVVPGERWGELGARDPQNQDLYDLDGTHTTYEQLIAAHGPTVLPSPDEWKKQAQVCQESLDRLAEHLAAASPDVVVIVGDDQKELFAASLQPTICVYNGATFTMGGLDGLQSTNDLSQMVREGYSMATRRTFDAHPDLASDIIAGLMAADVDVASSDEEPAGRGFGHAYGFVLKRLLGDQPVPVVPVLLNTFYPPNQPTPARCVRFGEALRAAIEASALPVRVALVASGGLSHFVPNESLDAAVLDAITAGDVDALADLPAELLEAGSSEIRNWITVASAARDRSVAFHEYVAGIRSKAGTGVGMAFLAWN